MADRKYDERSMKAIEMLLINVIYFIIVNFVALFFKLLCGHTFLRKSFFCSQERESPHSPAKHAIAND